MGKKGFWGGVVLVSCLAFNASAATLIESKIDDGSINSLWMEKGRIRIGVSNEPLYMLVDTVTGKMFSVNPESREIIDVSNSGAAMESSSAKKLTIQFEKKEQGPEIAGYQTTHYAVSVNGKKCSDEYLSPKAMKDIGDFGVLRKMNAMAYAGLDDIPENMMDPCDLAQFKLDNYYEKNGFPMRIVNGDGELQMEVRRISGDATPPSPGFDIPENFKSVQPEQFQKQDMQDQEEPFSPPEELQPPNVDNEELQRWLKENTQGQQGN